MKWLGFRCSRRAAGKLRAAKKVGPSPGNVITAAAAAAASAGANSKQASFTANSNNKSNQAEDDTERANESTQSSLLRALICDYQQVRTRFDELTREPYKAAQELEPLMSAFVARHQELLGRVQFEFPCKIKELLGIEETKCISYDASMEDGNKRINENLSDDLRVLSAIECKQKKLTKEGKKEEEEEEEALEEVEDLLFEDDPKDHIDCLLSSKIKDRLDLCLLSEKQRQDLHRLLADIFCRMSEALLRGIVYQKSCHKLELDRKQAVKWSQLALRHNANNFRTCYWYMLTVGWYLDNQTGSRDRLLASEAHKRAIDRCLEMEPENAHVHFILGRLYWHIGRLNWLQRRLAMGFISWIKLEGNFEDAEREFRRAHELRGDWMPTGLWMARTLLAQKKPIDEVRPWIKFGLTTKMLEPCCDMEREELVELTLKLGVEECALITNKARKVSRNEQNEPNDEEKIKS